MAKRTPPQKKEDEAAFPIRIRIALPFGEDHVRNYGDVIRWMHANIEPCDYAWHSSKRIADYAVGVYLVRLSDAYALLEAFPFLELADDTQSDAYTSPLKHRRRADLPPFTKGP